MNWKRSGVVEKTITEASDQALKEMHQKLLGRKLTQGERALTLTERRALILMADELERRKQRRANLQMIKKVGRSSPRESVALPLEP